MLPYYQATGRDINLNLFLMYAIVEIAGQQFKVEKDKKIYVHRLTEDEGSVVEFDKVLLINNNGKVNIGEPVIVDAMITAKILTHLKGDKVMVFKKKRRKGYQVLNGHRQFLTEILIEKIIEKGAATTKKAPKKAEVKPQEPKAGKKKADIPETKEVTKKVSIKPEDDKGAKTKDEEVKVVADKTETTKKETKPVAEDKKSDTKEAGPKETKETAKKVKPKVTAKKPPAKKKAEKPKATAKKTDTEKKDEKVKPEVRKKKAPKNTD